MSIKPKQTKKGLWAIMTPVMKEIRIAIILAGFAAFVSIMSFVLIAVAISITAGEKPPVLFGVVFSLRLTILLLLATTVTAFICRSVAFKVSHLGAFRLEEILRTQLSAHLSRVPLGYIITTGSGALKKVMLDDVKNLHAFVADSTPFVGRSFTAPVVSLVFMLAIDWRLTLAALSLLFAGGLLMVMVMRDSVELRKQYESSQEGVNAAVIEFVQAMPVVRTFDDGGSSFKRYGTSLETYRSVTKKWIAATGVPARIGMMTLSPVPTLAVVTAMGIWLMGRGDIDIFSFTASILLSTGMADSMMPLVWLTNFTKKSEASALRIQDVLSVKALPEIETPDFPEGYTVELDNVSFCYGDRDDYALKNVCLKVPEGTVTALVGPSGAGKSTVAKLIPRFWDVTEGSIKIGGADIRSIPSETLMNTVAFVFQDTFLFHTTIAENLRMAKPDATDEELANAAKSARIHDYIISLPDGYQTVAGDRGIRLSGGQKQRITIARAILRNAPIVVLDEATAFADPENEEEIISALAVLMKNKTVLVIAHRLSTIKDVDQIAVFEGGMVSETGRHKDLLKMGGVYARLWKSYENAQTWDLHRNGGRA